MSNTDQDKKRAVAEYNEYPRIFLDTETLHEAFNLYEDCCKDCTGLGDKWPEFIFMGAVIKDAGYRPSMGVSRGQARRLVVAKSVYDSLKGETLRPTNEFQIRPLVRLQADERKTAWRLACEVAKGKQPTSTETTYAAVHIQIHGMPKSMSKARGWGRIFFGKRSA